MQEQRNFVMKRHEMKRPATLDIAKYDIGFEKRFTTVTVRNSEMKMTRSN